MATDLSYGGSDSEFDQLLVDMKPHVIKLPLQTDRRLAASWIKKLCEPLGYDMNARKTRNKYARLLLKKVTNGVLDGPFLHPPPTQGSLAPLDGESDGTEDESEACVLETKTSVPDWVMGELGDTPGMASNFLSPRGGDYGLYDPVFNDARERFQEASNSEISLKAKKSETLFTYDRDVSPGSHARKTPPYKSYDYQNAGANGYIASDTTVSDFENFGAATTRKKNSKKHFSENWKEQPSFGSTFWQKDSSLPQHGSATVRDASVKNKMEAAFQEEKLRLQQRHDATVQKILDRKNNEIEDLKMHYRNKTKELEGQIEKFEKKVQQQQKELVQVKDQRNRQLEDLKNHMEQTSHTKLLETENKYKELVHKLEEEKADAQKQHTKAYKELLEDTNTRLQSMEEEYQQQMEVNSSVTHELETRVQQLSSDAESLSRIKEQLESDNSQLSSKLAEIQSQFYEAQANMSRFEQSLRLKTEEHEKELRHLKNKHEGNLEFYHKEHQSQVTKLTDTIADLELHLSQVKQSMERLEQDKTRQIRELEDEFYQEKNRLEHLYEKKIKTLQQDMDEIQENATKKVRKAEETLREKEDELRQIRKESEEKARHSEMALEEFKAEVEKNSNKIYEGLKAEMERVELDLNKSKQLREKQTKEYHRQLQDQRVKNEKQIAELRSQLDTEKSNGLQLLNNEREKMHKEHVHELQEVRATMKRELAESDGKAKERHEKDLRIVAQLEEDLQKMREDVIQANQLRKQQLLELGMLREEEKQNLVRDHEVVLNQTRNQYEQRLQELEKEHNGALEKVMDKTSAKLKEIENEYANRSQRSSATIADLQNTIEQLKMEVERVQQQSHAQLRDVDRRAEEEKQSLRQQLTTDINYLQQESEERRQQVQQLEKRLVASEQENEEKINSLRSHYEQKLRGTMSLSVRAELEDTIASLKQQISTLTQRCSLLQAEVDSQPMHHHAKHTPTAKVVSHGDTPSLMAGQQFYNTSITNGVMRGSTGSLPSKDTGM